MYKETIAVAMQVWNEEELLPLCINGLYDLPIDKVLVYNDCSTDRSIEILEDKLQNLSCEFEIKTVGKKHNRHFEYKEETSRFNQWHEDLKDYDWILHLDVDEIYSPQIHRLMGIIKNRVVEPSAFYFNLYTIVNDPYTFVWRLYDESSIQLFGYDEKEYHPLRKNLQLRLYRTDYFYYPEVTSGDTFPHPKRSCKFSSQEDVKILHCKFLNPLARLDHTSKEDVALYTDSRNTFRKLDRAYIPDRLIEYYRSSSFSSHASQS